MQTYHTDKAPIVVREFGRNMQKMILFAKDIEDQEKRQQAIERIVELVLDMYPTTNRNIEDYRIKIWSHVLQICEYELEVDIPENIPKEKKTIKPDSIPYPKKALKYRHYGKGIQGLIDKAIEMEDQEKKEEFITIIASFMKMSYKAWNRENASNEVIAQEMLKMSKGQLVLPKDSNIDGLITQNHNNKRSGGSNKKGYHQNNKRKNYKKRK